MIRLAVVIDDWMLAEGLRAWLAELDDIRLAAMAGSVEELLADRDARPDVVLFAIGGEAAWDLAFGIHRAVRAGHPVLVVGTCRDWATLALTAGAAGYLTRDQGLSALAEAVRAADRGEAIPQSVPEQRPRSRLPRFSPQERAVLLGYVSGLTLEAAARRAGVRPGTAKTYLARVKVKYAELGRPAFTKLELAERVREDLDGPALPR